jgi:opacity protein-like surface antigen
MTCRAKALVTFVGALTMLATGPASAQAPPPGAVDTQGCPTCPAPPPAQLQEAAVPVRRERMVGVELQALIGVADFTGGLGQVTSSGVGYGAQLGVSLHRFVAGMVRYEGSLHDVSPMNGGGRLAVNGVTAMFRLGLPVLPWMNVFLISGIGAMHVSIPGQALGGFFQDGWSAQWPVGGGLELMVTRWLGLGVDGTYHFLFNRGFEPMANHSRTRGTDLWATNATVSFHY